MENKDHVYIDGYEFRWIDKETLKITDLKDFTANTIKITYDDMVKLTNLLENRF